MKINDKIHGFTVTRIRDIQETGGRLVEMTHESTGAGLVWADNGEENKLFSVGFRTLPEDSTGVFHILEHSVLCGSAKFPVKEPFVELLKTSMNTFLNAMTYQDKTLYPVSSRIEQDYLNLTEVYLDAVFRPNILTNPNIFYQEGWHIDTSGNEPCFKGVVFNEMKGAMSDVDQLAERSMCGLLFPDNCYGYNSGGEPSEIPELSYESFIERYKRFYHPSNSYFYLDGDIPLEKTLSLIEEYLEGAGRRDDIPQFVTQTPAVTEKSISYAAGSEDDKPLVCFGRIIGSWADRDKMLALSIILEQLADSNESPLKRAVLSSGLAEDMEIYVSDGIAQPYLFMMFRGVSCEDGSIPGEDELPAISGRLLSITEETLDKILKEGFSGRDLEASVNQMNFRFRQYPEPQALYRANAVFASWLYGGDPALHLCTDEMIANVRAMIKRGEMEGLAEEILADTSSLSRLILVPDCGLGDRNDAEEAARVKSLTDAMSDAERDALYNLNENLLKWQQTDDSDEALSTIPQLKLSDIDPMPELIPTEEKEACGARVLFHPVASKGIVYINAYFPVTQLSIEELPAAALVSDLFKDLPTENYDVLSLQNELRMYVGSMSFGLDVLAKDCDKENCTPCLKARASVLAENLPHAEELLAEILLRTKFDDKVLLCELLTQIDEDDKRNAAAAGHRIALYEAKSHWSAGDAASEAVNSYSFIQFMHRMSTADDDELDAFTDKASEIIAKSITRENAIISVTADEYYDMSGFAAMLPSGEAMPETAHYESSLPKRMGIEVPSAISFAVKTYDMSNSGQKMNGSVSVASNIISLTHLWNVIRVQGGAYGASMASGRTGGIVCYTYRDPSPARSLDVFDTVSEFIGDFASEDADIDGLIISTIAQTEPLLSPDAKGRTADGFVLSGFSDKDRIRIRREMLDTKVSDLADLRALLDDMAEKGTVCVVGPRSALESCEGLAIYTL